jgi:hypothetical protein
MPLYNPATSGSLATDALADAKGDLFAATAADTITRVAVGTNDYVLTADSAQSAGVKWAASAGGAAPNLAFQPIISGRYIWPSSIAGQAGSSLTTSAGVVVARPIIFPRVAAFDRVAVRTSTAPASSVNMRVLFYATDSSTGLPAAVVKASAVMASGTAGNTVVEDTAFSWTPTVSTVYWMGLITDSAINSLSSANSTYCQFESLFTNSTSVMYQNRTVALTSASGYTASSYPDPWGSTYTETEMANLPIVAMRWA